MKKNHLSSKICKDFTIYETFIYYIFKNVLIEHYDFVS